MGPHEEGSLNIVMLLLSGRATPYLHNGVIYVGDEDHYVSTNRSKAYVKTLILLKSASLSRRHCPNSAYWLVLLSVYWYLKVTHRRSRYHHGNPVRVSKRQRCQYGWPAAVDTMASCSIRIESCCETITRKNDLNCITIRAPVAIWWWASTIGRKTSHRTWSVEAAVAAVAAIMQTVARTYCATTLSLRRWNDWFTRNGPKQKSPLKGRYRPRWRIDINLPDSWACSGCQAKPFGRSIIVYERDCEVVSPL